MAGSTDDYVLQRDLNGRIRLNMQHFTYPKIFGYLLHPTIPRRENLKIADVGTGSGIWMLDLAASLPASTKFHGFDLSLAQTTPQAWLPPNMAFSELDITQPIPEPLRGQFDVVNIRLFLIVVRDNDPLPILRNLVALLRPGGWLQWTEASNDGRYTDFVTAAPGLPSAALKELADTISARDARFTPTWPRRLAQSFGEVGLLDVVEDRRSPEDYRPWLAFTNDVVLDVYVELIRGMAEGPEKQRLLGLYKESVKESLAGVAFNAPRINVIGRRPE